MMAFVMCETPVRGLTVDRGVCPILLNPNNNPMITLDDAIMVQSDPNYNTEEYYIFSYRVCVKD